MYYTIKEEVNKLKKQDLEIKKGIKLHCLNTDKFKTNIIAIFLTTPITRQYVTYNAVLSSVLRRGSNSMPTQEQMSTELEEMYGASFDCGLTKTGDNHVLKFYLETINDEYLPQTGENLLKKSAEKLLDIVFNPLEENGSFKKEYVDQEKEKIRQLIEGKIDNKARYSMDRCIEEMYKDKPFGLYKYGYVEDLDEINEENLYKYYKKLIQECKIDIFISGKINKDDNDYIIKNKEMNKLQEREPNYCKNQILPEHKEKENIVKECMDVTQGKLVLGLNIDVKTEEEKYYVLVYNAILGGTANSKLFQNVREKASLAYTASSSYLRYKNNIFINCGIEINNYNKALEIIKLQLEDMKNGNFKEEDINDAKKNIISTIHAISDEQDTEISYYFGQELTNNNITVDEYENIIKNISKQQIEQVANKISINTIYFLTNED